MKYRFEKEFYNEVWRCAKYNKVNVSRVCAVINDKMRELCWLVTPRGALHILIQEKKL